VRFIDFEEVRKFFKGKTVAIVGSAPSVLENELGLIDSHDVVVRINNFKLSAAAGKRVDVFYSFFGRSIRKTEEELTFAGVKMMLCKCPNAKPIECEWHEKNGKQLGIDFRYIFNFRSDWWFVDTFVPSVEHFMRSFELLDRHIPSTGFAAILDVLECDIASAYITGFDMFTSGVHNVDEPWKLGDPADPIGHRPELEAAWLAENAGKYPLTFDATLADLMNVPA
jgi:hypothetical protein